MSQDNNVWGDEDDEFFLFGSQPVAPKPPKRDEGEINCDIENVEIKVEAEENTDWGGDEEDQLLCHASQMTEEKFVKSPPTPASGGPSGAMPVAASSPPIIIESRAISFLNNRQQENESKSIWSGSDKINELGEKMQKMEAENMAYREKVFALEGENSTLRRNLDTTIHSKNQEVHDRLSKQIEEKKKEADKKREAADEKEKLNSELASQKFEVLKLQWKVRHSKNRDMSMNTQMSPQQTSSHFPTAKSVLSKGIRPPVPKFFMSPDTVNKRLLSIVPSEKQLGKEADTRDFSLRIPATLADYENEEYKWESNDNGNENDYFLNLSNNSNGSQEYMEEDMNENSSDESTASDDSCADWEQELAQNPMPPVPPKEFIPIKVDEVIGRLKHVSLNSHRSPLPNNVDEEEKQNSVCKRLSDFATSRAPWVQSFGFVKKKVDHRFQSLKTLVADVARLTSRLIADLEIGSSADEEIQADEDRLWKWYLLHIDKKDNDTGRRVRSPSYMPSNCDAGPSMQFLEFINHLPIEPVTAWSFLSHVKIQLEDLIRISDIKNEWRIYERNNLEDFLKLLMWASELWPYVLEEENSPEIVRSHLPQWAMELRSWTPILLDIGNGDFLFHGEFHRTILTLVLEILAKVMKAGYFHPTADKYMYLSEILKQICNHSSELTCKHLMDICTVLKYGFKDNHFKNLLCNGENEGNCLMDNISNGYLVSFAKERHPVSKAKMFLEYVSTLNLLMHKDVPVYHTSKLARAKLIDKKTNLEADNYPRESFEFELTDCSLRAWLHPNNWEDPDKCRRLCQCRKTLCGNVIIMFSDILPLWREAINAAEEKLVALQKQHRIEDQEFLKNYEIDKGRKMREELEANEVEMLKETYLTHYDVYKRRNKFFTDSKLNFTCDNSDIPKVEELMQNLNVRDKEMEDYNEKKETLILRRKDYEQDIMTQGLLDNEIFSNWTQVGKLLRKRLGVNLPWWLKRYEREPTIFDQALEVGMMFMYHFLNCSNLASALGDEGLRDFLIVSLILKANAEDFLINDRIAPIIRELTTINNPQYPDDVSSTASDHSLVSGSTSLKKSHKLVYEKGCRILKLTTVPEEHLPDLKQSDLNRQKTLIDLEKNDFANSKESFTFRSLTKAEKTRIMETDDIIRMRKRLKRQHIQLQDIIRPTDSQSNALNTKQFLYPYRKAASVDEGSRYFNENGEDTTPQRHKRDKCSFVDDGRYSNFGTIDIGYVSETERKFFMAKGGEGAGSESVSSLSLNEDCKIDKEDLKKYLF